MGAPQIIAGVDEAGRGPLAGPVVAAAVILPLHFSALAALADSKTLSAKRREALAIIIRAEALVGVGIAEPDEIDRVNVLEATMRAMCRAVDHLSVTPDLAIVDGNRLPPLRCEARAIIGGDGLEPAISAASIIAKTVRDALMQRAAQRWPGYGLEGHKGYGAATHMQALQAIGASPIHRFSYRPVREAAEKTAQA
ncbi:MAG: ribonuclease HII [Caulobacterales bacterium]|uniref:ribonuclease HII n=1 Tax=Glycocaulis sp. TaxID=1969725 RepID=UPI003F9F22D4